MMGLDFYGQNHQSVVMMTMDGMGTLWGMWLIMIVAMMFPTLVPTIQSYGALAHKMRQSQLIGLSGLLLGYSAIWVVGACVLTGLQWALLSWGWLNHLGILTSPWASGGLLLMAGLYQFSQTKHVCQSVCLSPVLYFIGHWQRGFMPAISMGVALGGYCVVCCWFLMLLAFVGGVMNFLWMGLATVCMVLEKLPQIGQYITKPIGLSLIFYALFHLVLPYV